MVTPAARWRSKPTARPRLGYARGAGDDQRGARQGAAPASWSAARIERRCRRGPGEAAAVKITLKPSGGPFFVRGSIMDKAGKPLGWRHLGDVQHRTPLPERRVEKDGTFVLRDLPTNHCTIDAAAENEHATIETTGPGAGAIRPEPLCARRRRANYRSTSRPVLCRRSEGASAGRRRRWAGSPAAARCALRAVSVARAWSICRSVALVAVAHQELAAVLVVARRRRR